MCRQKYNSSQPNSLPDYRIWRINLIMLSTTKELPIDQNKLYLLILFQIQTTAWCVYVNMLYIVCSILYDGNADSYLTSKKHVNIFKLVFVTLFLYYQQQCIYGVWKYFIWPKLHSNYCKKQWYLFQLLPRIIKISRYIHISRQCLLR